MLTTYLAGATALVEWVLSLRWHPALMLAAQITGRSVGSATASRVGLDLGWLWRSITSTMARGW